MANVTLNLDSLLKSSLSLFQIQRSNEKANDYIGDIDLDSEESADYEDYEEYDDKNVQNYQCGIRNERGAGVFLRRFEFRVRKYHIEGIRIL